MRQAGFSLLELLITLTVLSVLLTIAVPGFVSQIEQSRLKTRTLQLQEALQTARQQAIHQNQRITLRPLGSWEQGWKLFEDLNNNGVRDPGEPLRLRHPYEDEERGINISANLPYVSYVSNGSGRWANGTPFGAFQAGSFTICGRAQGYRLVLAPSGRVRREQLAEGQC